MAILSWNFNLHPLFALFEQDVSIFRTMEHFVIKQKSLDQSFLVQLLFANWSVHILWNLENDYFVLNSDIFRKNFKDILETLGTS